MEAERQKSEKDKDLIEINSKIDELLRAQKDYEAEVVKQEQKAELQRQDIAKLLEDVRRKEAELQDSDNGLKKLQMEQN